MRRSYYVKAEHLTTSEADVEANKLSGDKSSEKTGFLDMLAKWPDQDTAKTRARKLALEAFEKTAVFRHLMNAASASDAAAPAAEAEA